MIDPSSSRTLERTFSAMNRMTSSGIVMLEMIELRLLAENGDAVLEVGQLDVGDHSPLEAGDEPCFEAGNLRWRPIAGQDDLPAAS